MSDEALRPGDAVKMLLRAIALPGVSIVTAYVPIDLANLRLAHTDDVAFARAVGAVAKEIVVALGAPSKHGVDAEFALTGWRRSKFCSSHGDAANFRLVFRERQGGGVEILAFGDRRLPHSVYLTARERTSKQRH